MPQEDPIMIWVERLAQGIEKHGVSSWHGFRGPVDMFKRLMNLDELDAI